MLSMGYIILHRYIQIRIISWIASSQTAQNFHSFLGEKGKKKFLLEMTQNTLKCENQQKKFFLQNGRRAAILDFFRQKVSPMPYF